MNLQEVYFKIVSSANIYTLLVIIAFLLLWIAFYKKPEKTKKEVSNRKI